MEIHRGVYTNGTSFNLSSNGLIINGDVTDSSIGINLIGNQLLKFNYDNVIDAAIVPSIDGTGNIEFTGGPIIEQKLGDGLKRLNSVEFSSNNPLTQVSLKRDINAKDINIGSLEIISDDLMGLYGDVITNNTILNLSRYSLVINGKLTNANANGALTIKGEELLKIEGDNIIDAKMVPSVNGAGKIEFTGSPTLMKSLGDANFEFRF